MKLLLPFLLMIVCGSVSASPRIAVVDFDTNQYSGQLAGSQLADFVVDELVNTSLFEVVEREKLSAAMREVGFGQSGMVDPGSASQFGKMLGARYVLTGRVISLGSEEKSFSGYGVNTRNTILSLNVSIRIFDTETGSVKLSTRTLATRTVNESGGLSVRSNTAYSGLAEEAAIQLVNEIVKSDKFGRDTESAPGTASALVEVTVMSEPEGADVEVDGIFYGNSGASVRVPQGLHSVKVSLAGHEPWEKKVMLADGMSLKATLARSGNQAD
ncbi:MAG: PEGA domain-containing protein [Xanthomonadales bacterium]|nr:PEGA domain-containing protein [Xanthomonadales bacterium]